MKTVFAVFKELDGLPTHGFQRINPSNTVNESLRHGDVFEFSATHWNEYITLCEERNKLNLRIAQYEAGLRNVTAPE